MPEAARPGPAPRAEPAPARRGWRRRLDDWFVGRLPEAESWTLTQRNLYILPTASGWAFAGMLVVMLLGSINYQLSLGYALTFLLAGCALVGMQLTHRTLIGLTLRLRPVAPVHAGEVASIEVVVDNRAGLRDSVGLAFHRRGEDAASRTWITVPAQGQACALLRFVPARRGWHAVPPIVVDTDFPLGLFRAWTVLRPAERVLAWPAPEADAPPLPERQALAQEYAVTLRPGGSELEGVRAWRRGDPLRQVLWKKVARAGELVSRDTGTPVHEVHWLDWSAPQMVRCTEEQRLSRLAAWVNQAARLELPVGLRLPGRQWPPALGEAHRRRMLEALALWP